MPSLPPSQIHGEPTLCLDLSGGYKRPLELADIGTNIRFDECLQRKPPADLCSGQLHPSEHSQTLASQLEARLFNDGRPVTVWKLFISMIYVEKFNMILSCFNKLTGDLLGFVGPLALSGIVKFVTLKSQGLEDEKMSGMEMGYWWLLAASGSAFLQNLLLQHQHQLVIRSAIRIKSTISLMVYRKSMAIESGARQRIGNGKIQNLQSADAFAVHFLFFFLNYAWAAPLQIAIATAMLYEQLGPSAFVGIAVLFLTLPVQTMLGNLMGKYTREAMSFADTRLKIINEILQGIRIVKLFAFERDFSKRVGDARANEMTRKRNYAVAGAINNSVLGVGPLLVALLSFLTYAYIEGGLTASVAFSSLTLFGILRLPLMIFPMLISAIVSARVSATRLVAFWNEPNFVDYRVFDSTGGKDRPAIQFQNAVLSWHETAQPAAAAPAKPNTAQPKTDATTATAPAKPDTSSSPFRLTLNADIPRGKLVQVVGQVGSGKSSMISAILGDMKLQSGRIQLNDSQGSKLRIAYSAQQPWIMNATLRENVLFGKEYDESRYNAVVEACALNPDLAILAAGDMTEIGEKGINLSGGQKARVSLARAVYSDADIVLLDDVLSAVDAHVARHIFEHAILGLLKGRTVVLASHQIQFLASADLLIVMHQGEINQIGTFEQLTAVDATNSSNLTLLQSMMAERSRIDNALQNTIATSPVADPGTPTSPTAAAVAAETSAAKKDDAVVAAESVAITVKPDAASKKSSGRIIVDEDRDRGSVPLRVYMGYLKHFGLFSLASMVFTLIANNVATVGVDFWLSHWSSNFQNNDVGYFVGIYGAITAAATILIFLHMLTWAFGSVRASSSLHASMLHGILRSPLRFFDSTPVGRVINRFSGDIETIDKQLPLNFQSYLGLLAKCVSTLIVQAIILPYTLIAAVPILVMYVLVQEFYRKSSREIKRLDNITKSPVFAHLSESLNGIGTVRAYNSLDRFVRISSERIDVNTNAYLKFNLINRWLGLRLDWIGSLLITITCLVAVLQTSTDPGLIGLAISYAMGITTTLNWLVRTATETETYLASVQRVETYAALPSERPEVIEPNTLPANWPSKGAIDISNVQVSYSEQLPPVLTEVSVRIEAGEKIGVCGRTGSGKSTLMLALYRILELQQGSIHIDGVDISSIGLYDLRSRLSIIPQDPVLFSGTLRYNLDPTGRFTEADLTRALSAVQMLEYVQQQPKQLDMHITDNGENLSVGQRQLLCVARALLRGSKILVLDEATASTDVASDAIIQSKLRELNGVTQLTIAHRINTIIDSDKILVLDHGRVAEFGTPSQLLANPDSMFSKLVRDTKSQ